MALSNRISGEFLSLSESIVPTSGKLNPGEVTVKHTGGQWLVVENLRAYYL